MNKHEELDSQDQVYRRGNILKTCLFYPRLEGHIDTIEIDLVDVRANDHKLVIKYNFERDHWVITHVKSCE